MTRIAVVDKNRCKPTKCRHECIRTCPPQRGGHEVITIIDIEDTATPVPKTFGPAPSKRQIAKIIESQCIGCNMCVKTCPFDAIRIVNLPSEKPADIVHRYGPNGFRLYRLPILRKGTILGLIGQNGIGKSTMIQILSGKLIPNFERHELVPTEVAKVYGGTALGEYFSALYNNKIAVVCKPQTLRSKDITVQDFIATYGGPIELCNTTQPGSKANSASSSDGAGGFLLWCSIEPLLQKNVKNLSGGELQRLYIYTVLTKEADLYIFDEPSNYLDVQQRLLVTETIRACTKDKYCVVIDHDLAMIDYLAEEIYILYGVPGAYGVCSQRYTVSEGINHYMRGYLPSENVRIRAEEFYLKSALQMGDEVTRTEITLPYEGTTVEYLSEQGAAEFRLDVSAGFVTLHNSIYVILGRNGTGKSTFMSYLKSSLGVKISWKPQDIGMLLDKESPVLALLMTFPQHSSFQSIIKPLCLTELGSRKVSELSGGELQKLCVAFCLAQEADVYLIDEPSANLDIETRLVMISVVKRFILHFQRCAFIIEHDIMMAVALSQEWLSKILLVTPGDTEKRHYLVGSPVAFTEGINSFLRDLGITMRFTERPRINKIDSTTDREQKQAGVYYQ